MVEKEHNIEDYFISRAHQIGGFTCKTVSPSYTGFPDRFFGWRGRCWLVELKRPGGKPRKRQEFVHNELRQHGIEVHMLDTKTKIDNFFYEIQSTCISANR